MIGSIESPRATISVSASGRSASRSTSEAGNRSTAAGGSSPLTAPGPAEAATSSRRTGTLVSRVCLDGPEAYGFTAAMLAWGATRAAEHGVGGAGALGPVQAFGLEPLTAGAAEVGLLRA